MRASCIRLFWLLALCAAWQATGWLNPAIAADAMGKDHAKPAAVEGEIQFIQPQAPCSPEPAKDECPTTFGPIITDTAIPIEKGKFAIQPTFGMGFTTGNFSPSWKRMTAGGDFKSFGMDWKFTYGLLNNLEVFVVHPLCP